MINNYQLVWLKPRSSLESFGVLQRVSEGLGDFGVYGKVLECLGRYRSIWVSFVAFRRGLERAREYRSAHFAPFMFIHTHSFSFMFIHIHSCSFMFIPVFSRTADMHTLHATLLFYLSSHTNDVNTKVEIMW